MQKTIIFDLGNVLIEWDRRALFKKLFNEGTELDYFLDHVCSLEWNSQIDLGGSFEKAVQERILDYPEYTLQIQAYLMRWDEMITGTIPGMVKILNELREAEYPLAVLSNWSAETFPRVSDRFEFLGWFNPLILSGEIGLIKPDPEIYHHLLRVIDRCAADCIFIDDSLPN
ncbi:MAG: HAD-IA family hydrolase, partial [Anaerolineales bacterium]|nr:HAD-IA family hydrolase [Anaerolineales bacterium]